MYNLSFWRCFQLRQTLSLRQVLTRADRHVVVLRRAEFENLTNPLLLWVCRRMMAHLSHRPRHRVAANSKLLYLTVS